MTSVLLYDRCDGPAWEYLVGFKKQILQVLL